MQVYLIENIFNKKVYIGKTSKTLDTRLKQHIYTSKKLNTPLSKAICKYGKQNFIIKLLENTIDNSKENFWINKYINILGKQNIYNATKGGDGGDTYSNNPNLKSIKQKLSTIQKSIQNKPDIKQKAKIRMQKRWQDINYQNKISNDMLKTWQNNAIRKQQLAQQSKLRWKNKKFKLKHKKIMQKNWNNPDYYLKVSKAIKAAKANDREKAKIKWKQIYGNDLEQKLIILIKNNAKIKNILSQIGIKSHGQLYSILQMFFNYKSIKKIKLIFPS